MSDLMPCGRCCGKGRVELHAALAEALEICRELERERRPIRPTAIHSRLDRRGRNGELVGITAVHNTLTKLASLGFLERIGERGTDARYRLAQHARRVGS